MLDAVLPRATLRPLLLLGHLQHRDAGVRAVGAQGGLRRADLAAAPTSAWGELASEHNGSFFLVLAIYCEQSPSSFQKIERLLHHSQVAEMEG